MSDDAIKKLDILSQSPTVIGEFDGKTVRVYPPSISRYREVTQLIAELPEEVQDFVSQSQNKDADDKLTVTEQIAIFQKILFAMSERIAPVVVAMTAKPAGGGKWNNVLTVDQVENDLSAKTCLEIFSAYEAVASVPELSKKMTALSR
jgi:hypothetical protein